jgi:Cdc6-like AAA superfamily ATPase
VRRRVLATIRGAGIDVAYACYQLREKGSQTTSTPLHFVGRSDELGALHAALDAAEAGRSSVVVLHGEEGVGKTRTAAQFADEARERGARDTE